jgi:hypothetical protein
MEQEDLALFVGLSVVLGAVGVVLVLVVVPADLASRLFVGVQWVVVSLLLAYLFTSKTDVGRAGPESE